MPPPTTVYSWRVPQWVFPALAGAIGLGGVLVLQADWKDVFEIALFFLAFVVVLRFMRGTRGEGMLKGIVLITIVGFAVLLNIAKELKLRHLELALTSVAATTVIVFVILFQQELRRALLQLGEAGPIKLFFVRRHNPVDQVIEAALRLARNKVGALVAFERETGLKTYIERGVPIDADVGPELLETIFYPGSPLHDGAVIVKGSRIAAAGCLFPLTDNTAISKKLGTRHRAAIGLGEETDAVTLCVSEETGAVSVGENGILHYDLDADQLREILKRLVLAGEEKAIHDDEATEELSGTIRMPKVPG